MPPITNSFGLLGLVAMARVNGGGERNIEPGFQGMQKLKNSVITFELQAGKFCQLFQSKQAWIGIWGSGRTYALADLGFPVDFVYPQEGAYDLGIMIQVVKNCKNPKPAQKFVNYRYPRRHNYGRTFGCFYGARAIARAAAFCQIRKPTLRFLCFSVD